MLPEYIITSARNAAAITKGMVELRSIVFYSREERRRWGQGPRCLRCLKLRMVGGLGGMMMTPRRSSGCGACVPELTTRRHRGPLLCLGSRAKASILQGRDRRFTSGSAFHMSFRGLPSLLATQQKWYNHVQQVAQSLIPHNYRQYRCTSKLYFYLNSGTCSTSRYRSPKQEARAPVTVNGSRRIC